MVRGWTIDVKGSRRWGGWTLDVEVVGSGRLDNRSRGSRGWDGRLCISIMKWGGGG